MTTLSAINKNDTIFSNTEEMSKCSSSEIKSDEECVKSNPKKSDNTLDRSLKGLAHLKQSFRPFSTPKRIVEKDKNEPSKFLGDGVTFKAKLIGILEVEDARGDRMCQEALNELKIAVRAAGEHKQRINIIVSIEGLRLRDEKTGDCLYHHPVHKISFIAQDVADSRAFGYIFGSPDTGHRFFGIKTDKSASQVVIAMRDLFQVVYELKKREVEIAKQNIEQHQLKYGSNLFLDSISATSSKSGGEPATKAKLVKEDSGSKSTKNKTQTAGVIADLMDLELELNSLQQGLSQMERITPSDPFGPPSGTSKDDPFGDSFTPPLSQPTTTPPPTKLPPPPAAGDRRKTTSSSALSASQSELHWFDRETQHLFGNEITSSSNTANKQKVEDTRPVNENSYQTSKDLFDIFTELDPLGTGKIKPYVDKKDFFQELKNPPKKLLKDLVSTDNLTDGQSSISSSFKTSIDKDIEDNTAPFVDYALSATSSAANSSKNERNTDMLQPAFANFASFDMQDSNSSPQNVRKSPLIQSDSSSSQSSVHGLLRSVPIPERPTQKSILASNEDNINLSTTNDSYSNTYKDQWSKAADNNIRQKIVINLRKVLSSADDTDKENDSPVMEDGLVLRNPDVMSPEQADVSSDSFESIPEPPPRPVTSPLTIQPPPLPPKKVQVPITMKPPPPRPPSSERVSHYDYIENYESLRSYQQINNKIPPIPAPARKSRFSYDTDIDVVRKRPLKHSPLAKSDYYLTPISEPLSNKIQKPDEKVTPSLNITLKQLTSSDFNEIAAAIGIHPLLLSKMTLKELTECLSKRTQTLESSTNSSSNFKNKQYTSLKESFDEEFPSFKVDFDTKFSNFKETQDQVDKYAVFRELISREETQTPQDKQTSEGTSSPSEEVKEDLPKSDVRSRIDRYAALRDICPTVSGNNNNNNNIVSSKGKNDSAETLMVSDSNNDLNSNNNNNIDDDKNNDDNDNNKSNNNNSNNNIIAIIDNDNADDSTAVQCKNIDTQSPVVNDKEHNVEIAENSIKDADNKSDVAVDKESTVSFKKSDNELEITFDENANENKLYSNKDNLGKNWTKFETVFDRPPSFEEKNTTSPWNIESVEKERISKATLNKCRKAVKMRNKVQKHWNDDDDDDYDDDEDDTDENWESSKKSQGSSWEDSSWKENGWSDRDSLYEENISSPSYRDRRYQIKKKGYHRKFSPLKKSLENSPWEEEKMSNRRTTPKYKGIPSYTERNYNDRKPPPPYAGLATSSRTTEYEPPEEDELKILRMVLGEKRLKELEDQLFKQYLQKEPSKKSPAYNYFKDAEIPIDNFADLNLKLKQKQSRKHYYAPRPKSADKARYVGHPNEDMFPNAKYRRPYSHDELSGSEDDTQWPDQPPSYYVVKPNRSRNHSQTSPFEDNFSPQDYDNNHDHMLYPTYDKMHYKNKANFSPTSRFSLMFPPPPLEKHLKDSYLHAPHEFKRSSRDSSQRQSPFENDFTAPELRNNERSISSEDGRRNEALFYSGISTIRSEDNFGRMSRYESARNDFARREINKERPDKHYENVEVKRITPETFYYDKPIVGKEGKYKAYPLMKDTNSDTACQITSPKKNKQLLEPNYRKHNPFNDNAYESSKTMPKLQKSKTRTKPTISYHSGGSDSPESLTKWKEDFNSFKFPDHSHK